MDEIFEGLDRRDWEGGFFISEGFIGADTRALFANSLKTFA